MSSPEDNFAREAQSAPLAATVIFWIGLPYELGAWLPMELRWYWGGSGYKGGKE